MTQSDFGIIDINEDGPTLAVQLQSFRDAVQSSNKGPAAPTYAKAGTRWIDDSASPWVVKTFDGTDWIVQFSIDPVANAIIIATAALTLASLAQAQAGTDNATVMTPLRVANAIATLAIAASRQIIAGSGLAGGGDLSADRTISMATPGTLTGATSNSSTAPHTHNVNLVAADVMPTAIGQVGGYALVYKPSVGAISAGATVAGSLLGYGTPNESGNASVGLAGTWRIMGLVLASGVINSGPSNLALRIA